MKNIIVIKNNKDIKITHYIRSFVCRNSRITTSQNNAFKILWPEIGINFNEKLLSFDSLFNNNNPVILEIGFGMGDSLVTMAKELPNKNFLGIEVYKPGIGSCLLAAKKSNLNNLKIIYHDAIEVLNKMLPDNSLNIVQLFFPDPWPKLKHNKRRILQESFAKLILRKLKLNAIFHIVTDWQPYAKHILDIMYKINSYKNLSITGDYIPKPNNRPITKFEKKGKKLGYKIFDIIFKKIK